jgi:hypothetical protein
VRRSCSSSRLSHKPLTSPLDRFYGWAPKTAISSRARGPSVARSWRRAALAGTTTAALPLLRIGFMRHPQSQAAVPGSLGADLVDCTPLIADSDVGLTVAFSDQGFAESGVGRALHIRMGGPGAVIRSQPG